MFNSSNALIRSRSDTIHISQSRCVLATDMDGFVRGGVKHGLLVFETRMLSKYVMRINGEPLIPVVLSNIQENSWLGYYVSDDLSVHERIELDMGSGRVPDESERTLEVRLSRFVAGGVHEDIDLTNYTGENIEFEFSIEMDSDFADITEMKAGKKIIKGKRNLRWHEQQDRSVAEFSFQAEHKYSHQGNEGVAQLSRQLDVIFHRLSSPVQFHEGTATFKIKLKPFEEWHACVEMIPVIEGKRYESCSHCHNFAGGETEADQLRSMFFKEATAVSDPENSILAPVVFSALKQAKDDLGSLRLYDLDAGPRTWTVGAGLPIYAALYGRDALTASWQAALLGPEMMKGALHALAETQATDTNDWLDAQPGRMIHEIHHGPLAHLRYNPQARNYGSITTTLCYPLLVAQLWHWTGSREAIAPYVEPALKALQWAEKYGDNDGDGFYDYQTRSEQGVRNQGWKDTNHAIVTEDGEVVEPPIAMCEEQGFAYASKFFFAEVLLAIGKADEARRLWHEAAELKKHFNDVFWDENLGYLAMALGPEGKPIHAIASDAGHCLTTGIVDDALAPRVAKRMFGPDLFSGWGIRTLSSENPAYNPYNYHRGSVWPVETATFMVGFKRFGFHHETARLAKSLFELAALFEHNRLPEVISGHARDQAHPIPAIYPQANSPQAWSASAVVSAVQALLGIYPFAPLKILLIDPVLPDWLPRLQVSGLRVGEASVDLSFFRKEDGTTDYQIKNQRGELHVVRQANPWSVTSGWDERLRDGLQTIERTFT